MNQVKKRTFFLVIFALACFSDFSLISCDEKATRLTVNAGGGVSHCWLLADYDSRPVGYVYRAY